MLPNSRNPEKSELASNCLRHRLQKEPQLENVSKQMSEQGAWTGVGRLQWGFTGDKSEGEHMFDAANTFQGYRESVRNYQEQNGLNEQRIQSLQSALTVVNAHNDPNHRKRSIKSVRTHMR